MKSLELFVERIILAARWILVVFYLGLAAALVVYAASFIGKFVKVAASAMTLDEADMILAMLGLIDAGKNEGARITTGGPSTDQAKGWFIEPTVFGDVENGMTKTFEATGIIEMKGVGSLEMTGQYQEQTDNEGNTDSTTSSEAVVRDEDGNSVASAGELEDDNWPEDDEDLPVGPGDDAAGAGFDLERDDETNESGGSDGPGRADAARGAVGAIGGRDDGPARPGVEAAGDPGAGPRGDGVYVQEIPSGVRAAGAAVQPDGPGVVFEPNDEPYHVIGTVRAIGDGDPQVAVTGGPGA